MKNILITSLGLLAFSSAYTQVKVTTGSNTQDFKVVKAQPVFTSFATDNTDYFVVRRTEHFEKINTFIEADKTGKITLVKEIRIDRGVFSDNYEVTSVLVVGNTAAAFVEHHDKNAGKNTLSVRLIDNNGNISSTSQPIAEIPFAKLNSPGDWHVALTPDKKHVAVVGQLPHEKDMPDQFIYSFLDENLKETAKGKFTFAGNTKAIPVWNFLASDKGDLYLIAEEFDKSYKLPVVYKSSVGSDATSITPLSISDPGLKNYSYKSTISPSGDLIVAGYMQKKSSFSMGDVKIVGSWLFNSSKPLEVKTYLLDKPVTNLTARNIVYNGDTFFLVGEQYLAEKEQSSTASMQITMEENFNYQHNDIQVTAFGTDGTKKFDLPISRKWSSRNFDQELMIASGIINNKLALIYNDQYGKYLPADYSTKNNKLAVAVLINSDGLMDAPVNFGKELSAADGDKILTPLFFSNSKGKMVVLLNNFVGMRTETFE